MAAVTRRGRLVVAGLVLALGGAGTGAYFIHAGQPATAQPALAATTAIDPRLILRLRLLPISGTLAGGAALRGAIYPAIPGVNTIHLALPSGAAPAPGAIIYRVTMPGMIMRPVTGTLQRQGGTYTGTITLPMFGLYQGTLMPRAASGGPKGSLTLSIPLPKFQ